MVLVAIIASVLVWYQLQQALSTAESKSEDSVIASSTTTPEWSTIEEPYGDADSSQFQSEETTLKDLQPVYVSDLSLSPEQRSLAKTMGIDLDTFIITPTMQECARRQIGVDRLEEIITGSSPTLIESTKLLGCAR